MNFERLDEQLTSLRRILESDEGLRQIERKLKSGDKAAAGPFLRELARAGRGLTAADLKLLGDSGHFEDEQMKLIENTLRVLGEKRALDVAQAPSEDSRSLSISNGPYYSMIGKLLDNSDAGEFPSEQASSEFNGDGARLYPANDGLIKKLDAASVSETKKPLTADELRELFDAAAIVLRHSSQGLVRHETIDKDGASVEIQWGEIRRHYEPDEEPEEDEEGESDE